LSTYKQTRGGIPPPEMFHQSGREKFPKFWAHLITDWGPVIRPQLRLSLHRCSSFQACFGVKWSQPSATCRYRVTTGCRLWWDWTVRYRLTTI